MPNDTISSAVRRHVELARELDATARPPGPGELVGALNHVVAGVEALLAALDANANDPAPTRETQARVTTALSDLERLGVRLPGRTRAALDRAAAGDAQ